MQISLLNKVSSFTTQKEKQGTKTQVSQNSLSKISFAPNTKENKSQKIYASHLSSLGINFKAKSDDLKTIDELSDEYNWYVNKDKTRPLDAFLKIKTSKEKMNELFTTILKDKERSYALIDDIAGRAREATKNYETLGQLLGKDSDNIRLFLPQNPYFPAFESYMDEKYNQAKSLESLLKLRPDWRESALVEKYKQLNNGSSDLKIGNLPDEFKDGRFDVIYDYLCNYLQTGFKTQKDIPPLKVGNRTYNFEYFTQGKTEKNVFGVYSLDKKYVFKIADPAKRSLNAPYSLGALALIDRYLTLNNCRNIAPLYYYDHNKNVCIYKYQNHNAVEKHFSSPLEVNHYMPDFKALGMCYNDTIGCDNYFLSDYDCRPYENALSSDKISKELISVDNDHVTYSSPFMLLVTKYNAPLPNEMQRAF